MARAKHDYLLIQSLNNWKRPCRNWTSFSSTVNCRGFCIENLQSDYFYVTRPIIVIKGVTRPHYELTWRTSGNLEDVCFRYKGAINVLSVVVQGQHIQGHPLRPEKQTKQRKKWSLTYRDGVIQKDIGSVTTLIAFLSYHAPFRKSCPKEVLDWMCTHLNFSRQNFR